MPQSPPHRKVGNFGISPIWRRLGVTDRNWGAIGTVNVRVRSPDATIPALLQSCRCTGQTAVQCRNAVDASVALGRLTRLA